VELRSLRMIGFGVRLPRGIELVASASDIIRVDTVGIVNDLAACFALPFKD